MTQIYSLRRDSTEGQQFDLIWFIAAWDKLDKDMIIKSYESEDDLMIIDQGKLWWCWLI